MLFYRIYLGHVRAILAGFQRQRRSLRRHHCQLQSRRATGEFRHSQFQNHQRWTCEFSFTAFHICIHAILNVCFIPVGFFSSCAKKGKQERTLLQFHYTEWHSHTCVTIYSFLTFHPHPIKQSFL